MTEIAQRDPNRVTTAMGVTNDSNLAPTNLRQDPVTLRLLTSGVITANALTSTPSVGQIRIAVTGTAVQLPSNTLINGVIITAYSLNAAPIIIGTSNAVTNVYDGTGNGTVLEPSASLSFAVTNSNVLWINGVAGDFVSISGS